MCLLCPGHIYNNVRKHKLSWKLEKEHTLQWLIRLSHQFLLDSSVYLLLGVWMSFNLWFEEQLPQLAVRGFAHGFGLHTHLVFVWRKLICTVLLMPQVEKATRRRANHHQLTVKVLPVQVHVLQAPTFDVTVKTTCKQIQHYENQEMDHLTLVMFINRGRTERYREILNA